MMMKINQKNKILFLINKLGVGGAERVFIRDANTLKQEGFDVYFAFLFGLPENQLLISELSLTDDKLFYCHLKSIYDFFAIKKLYHFVAKNNINIIYSTLNESNIIARFLRLFNFGLKVFIREANVAFPKPLQFKILDILFNWLVNKIICVSKEVSSSLSKYQPFYSKKMIVLMNGVEISNNQKKYPINIELPINILSVGSLTIKKGYFFLIKALGVVQTKYPDSFLLTIIGDGSEKEKILKLSKENAIAEKVKLIGSLSKSELSNYYLSSDLFILSSIYEGCPNVLLEASSLGLACISTKVSGVPEIIDEGISGKMVQHSDPTSLSSAICYVIENRNKVLAQYGKNAREKMINNFSMSVRLNKLITILK